MAPSNPNITSKIKPTHMLKAPHVQAWQYTGQAEDKMPDWVKSGLRVAGKDKPKTNYWAIRDKHGYLEQWLSPKVFEEKYETID